MSSSGKLFVGNLAYKTDEQTLRNAFERFGSVVSASIVTDRETGRSKGFAFVQFESPSSADNAITEMHGYDLDGRSLNVNHARDKGSGGGGGGGRYGGRGGGYGGRDQYGGGDGSHGGGGNYGNSGGYGGGGGGRYGGGGGYGGGGSGGYGGGGGYSGGGYGGSNRGGGANDRDW